MVYDSISLGARWAEDGPEAGYFPFYIGALICAASIVNFVRGALVAREKDGAFVERGQLKLVLSVLVALAPVFEK